MKKVVMLFILLWVAYSGASAQSSTSGYVVYNRTITQLAEGNKTILRFSEGPGAGIAWIKDAAFTEGTIEFDVRGRDVMQKSFVGIAFHGKDNETYETVYLRPFNFQSADPARKIHAVQYAFEPKFGFQELRNTQKDKYESAILPADLKATDWVHVKVEVKAGKIQVFLNGYKDSCMSVTTLNPDGNGTKIGFWVGNASNGDFANLKISK